MLETKELVFVSGKGGTGKSTVATLLARDLSQRGRSVLLVELAEQSSVQALLQSEKKPHYQPQASGFGFDWCRLQGRDCLVEYVSSFTRLESVTQKFFDSALLKTLVNVAPGLNDLSILGKLTSRIRKHGPAFNYDHIVVDAPSTGSFMSLINAPVTLGKSVARGPLHSQSMGIDEVLKNPKHTQFFFVSLYEELPMDELEDTIAEFQDEFGEQIRIVMNKALDVAKPAESKSSWSHFLQRKMQEENRQGRRAQELWPKGFQLNLFTDPFKDYIHNHSGEALRPL